jgi:putative RNA 2'-phosphotransferase
MDRNLIKTSKFLSLVLRHEPERIGLSLDAQGWARIDDLLERASANGVLISRETLTEIVETNEKRRFAISDDGIFIRASQGHSIDVDLELTSVEPPALLYHGTAIRFLPPIRQSGLLKMARQHVHLSADEETAHRVGQRHGKPVVLIVEAGKMHRAGHPFFLSANQIWLTDHVPPAFLQLPPEQR